MNLIKKIRLNSGYTQSQLAKKLGIASTTLSGYEIGLSQPRFDMVVKIANICDYDVVLIDRNNKEQIVVDREK